MIEYLISIVGIVVVVWLFGYGITLRKLNRIPGFPVNKRVLLVIWPLTLIAIKFLEPEDVLDDFMNELEDHD